jgi:NADH:ubiquinone oxidoreductase subunit 5 (subunit L)/multisubunit Na+/H+ antiporter MnhA subunit
MPRTAAAFLVGSLAIVGLPPLNGFVGEWITIQGALSAAQGAGPVRFAGLVAAAIGLVGALALACFLRLGSAVFLGHPRSGGVAASEDAPQGMRLALLGLAAGCLLIGLDPAMAVGPAARVSETITAGVSLGRASWAGAGPSAGILGIFAGILVILSLLVRLLRGGSTRGSPPALADTWACAFPAQTGRMQYTASSFSAPLLGAFPAGTAPERLGGLGEFRTAPTDRVLSGLAIPLWERLRALAFYLRPLQQGRVTTYLRYIIWAVLLLLGYLSLASRSGPP